jgi:4-amino-4-deoxy-L-arabinose transferase-like glycosyltransferase
MADELRKKDIAITVLLLLILSAALLVRLGGMWFDLPYAHHWDEPNVMHNVFRMMKTHDFHPRGFFHTSGYIYLQLPGAYLHYALLASQGKLASLNEIQTIWETGWPWTISHPSFYVWARALTVILSTATVFLVYKMGSKTHSAQAGLLGAFFLAFAFGHIEHSRPITSDVPVTFFDTFAVLAAVSLVLSGKKRWYVLAGVMAGYAAATKYNNGLVLVAFLAAHLLNSHKSRTLNKSLLIGILCLVAGFLAGSPYSILDPKAFIENVAFHLGYFGEEHAPDMHPGFIPGIAYYGHYIFYSGLGKFLAIFACLGIPFALFKKFRPNLVLVIFPAIYFLFMSLQTYRNERFAVPLMPFLALFAAVGVISIPQIISSWWPKFQKAQNLAIGALAFLVIFAPAKKSIKDAWLTYHSQETRVRAAEWMKRNLPAGSRVAIVKEFHWYLPDLEDANLLVIPLGALEKPPHWYSENRIDYIVATDNFGGYYSGVTRVSENLLTQYNTRFANATLVQQFGRNTLWLEHFSIDPKVLILKPEIPAPTQAIEGKELVNVHTEEKAPGPDERPVGAGGKPYPWKQYKFALDATSQVYIKLTAIAQGQSLDVMGGADDRLTIKFDDITLPWNSYYALNGAILKGRTKEVELTFTNIPPGEHTLTLLAHRTPTLLSLEVTAFIRH